MMHETNRAVSNFEYRVEYRAVSAETSAVPNGVVTVGGCVFEDLPMCTGLRLRQRISLKS